MRKSRFTEAQISMSLRQGEAGTPVEEILRKLGISQVTYFRWKKKYGSLGVPVLRELRQLRDENRKLKGLVADLSLDKTILQEALKKMVRPAQRRDLVSWAIASYQISERQACRATGSHRSLIRYRSVRPQQEELRRRIREIAAVRTRAGYTAIHTLLRRVGWRVNRKRSYRLYREEGLSLRIRRLRRHRSAIAREKPVSPHVQGGATGRAARGDESCWGFPTAGAGSGPPGRRARFAAVGIP